MQQQMINSTAKARQVRPLEETVSGFVRMMDGSNRIFFASMKGPDEKRHLRTRLYPVFTDGTVSPARDEKIIPLPNLNVEILFASALGIGDAVTWAK